MEFRKLIKHDNLNTVTLKQLLVFDNLTKLCASISSVTSQDENEGDMYCSWGGFHVRRDELKHGVRFSLINCPHALAWTITYDASFQEIIIHCTIDKAQTDADFIESIHDFVADWHTGISAAM